MSANPLDAYQAAGVDVSAGDAFVERIKPLAAATGRPGAFPSLGGFGGAFDLGAAGHEGSLLIAATDGVGTKLRLASDLADFSTVGIDLVAMCVNDILAQGAEPLFFLDYYATGKLDLDAAEAVVRGIATGCEDAGCALIGGETAEMPGHYAPGDFDLAGFAVGAVKRECLLPQGVAAGDVLVALASSGAHSNGFSLIRKLAAERSFAFDTPFERTTLGAALLAPTRIYVRPVLLAIGANPGAIHGIAHITGGGLTGNVPRFLPPGTVAAIERATLPRNPVMEFLSREGGLDAPTLEATFNAGAGLVLDVSRAEVDGVIASLTDAGEAPVVIGEVVPGEAGDEPTARIG